jgi:hypothetical protein
LKYPRAAQDGNVPPESVTTPEDTATVPVAYGSWTYAAITSEKRFRRFAWCSLTVLAKPNNLPSRVNSVAYVTAISHFPLQGTSCSRAPFVFGNRNLCQFSF